MGPLEMSNPQTICKCYTVSLEMSKKDPALRVKIFSPMGKVILPLKSTVLYIGEQRLTIIKLIFTKY